MKRPVKGIKGNRILSDLQKEFLHFFKRAELSRSFWLSGGTALSAFYLEHRYSEDLDLFSAKSIPAYEIEALLRSWNRIEKIHRSRAFERNIYTIYTLDKKILKIEFVRYPLRLLYPLLDIEGIKVESFVDIIVNKLCSIADRSDPKDYVDVYFGIKQGGLSLKELLELAQKKCEISGIDHILKNQLLQIPEGAKGLSLIKEVDPREMERFFLKSVKEIIEEELEDREI